MAHREVIRIGERDLIIETGRLARQAGGAALVHYGDTMVLVTVCAAKNAKDIDFLPLTCEYFERTFAAGKIPGGFFKREGRPTEKEILTSRLIDRPCRPLFTKGWNFETQVLATVLSADPNSPPDVVALCGAGAALELSDVPFLGPVGGVRVGRVNGELIANPTLKQLDESDLDIVMAATRDAIVMVEGGANLVSEEVMLNALEFGHQSLRPFFDAVGRLREVAGKPKRAFEAKKTDEALAARVSEVAMGPLQAAFALKVKQERYGKLDEIKKWLLETLCTPHADGAPKEFTGREAEVLAAQESVKKRLVRGMILRERRRIDGRALDEIRPITCEVGVLPRTHGAGLFTRGETQALVTTTLGTSQDEQRIDGLLQETSKRFMLHYNFPPFSVGETKPMRGPSRREIGHGALAERSILRVMPTEDRFPYTIRVVSEILESNGSSSMASVCGATLSLMDAGVPITAPVAGIAMGLIKEGDSVAVLSDILGDEDHLGDMDFKVTGTHDGIAALQMDIKIGGLSREIMERALYQAREGRIYILDKMSETISAPRKELKEHAPRIVTMQIKPERIRDVIGPSGRTIKGIIEETGVTTIEIEDDGKVSIAATNEDASNKALRIIRSLTREAEVGQFYVGTVKRIAEFGAFVEILPGIDGLVHISEMAKERVNKVTDIVREGDEITVKVINVDRDGKIRLSRKEALGVKIDDYQ
jgi:polyribonucleotide nucleotidyltransferase